MNSPLSINSQIPFNPERHGYPVGLIGRLLLTVCGLCLPAGFAVAYSLEPDPRGFGTHERLNLPGCTFRTMFGVACPSCGMTTSFAHFTRGAMFSAASANVAGLALAVVCVAGIPWCWISAATGRLWRVSSPDTFFTWLMLLLFGVCFVQWIVRLLLAV